MNSPIFAYRNWIFDMDGTLTVACHDFDGIRRQLGLPENAPILEALSGYPEDQARMIQDRLFEIEMDLARTARPQPGVEILLEALLRDNHRIGILTRNHLEIAFATLNACGLAGFFSHEDILGRECCPPKPDPSGVRMLMERWQCGVDETVLVGDYVFDLECGHRAGVPTIHLDVTGEFAWPQFTRHRASGLGEIHGWVCPEARGDTPRSACIPSIP